VSYLLTIVLIGLLIWCQQWARRGREASVAPEPLNRPRLGRGTGRLLAD
jgi:hypothetical protein